MNTIQSDPLIVLFGQPNAGKTTIYNALTGSRYDTVNYPGTTIDYAVGRIELGPPERPSVGRGSAPARVLDCPGFSSVSHASPDEQIALDVLFGKSREGRPDIFVAVVDTTQLARHLYIPKLLIESGYNVVVAATMVDLLESRKNMKLDVDILQHELGCPVVRVDAGDSAGVAALKSAVADRLAAGASTPRPLPELTDADVARHFRALRVIEERVVRRPDAPDPLEQRTAMCRHDSLTEQLDRILLHPLYGGLSFALIMTAIFSSIFWLAQPLMDAVDGLFAASAAAIHARIAPSWLTDLAADGIVTGVGAVAVFIPQIAILFLGMGLMEGTGYLSRGAMIVDKPLSWVGLSGRAFVPMLSAFACAIPAMMAARTVPARRERMLTIFMLPLMVCSARLPVYGLLLAFLTPPGRAWLGGLGMTGLYLFSVAAGLAAVAILGRFLKAAPLEGRALMLELPSLRRPNLRAVVTTSYYRTKMYIQKAGGVILVVAVVLWALTHLPYRPDVSESEQLRISLAATLGQWLEPVMRPMGLDWRVGVALICAFAAREVFVSALALVLMVSGGGMDDQPSLLLAMRSATLADGSPLFTFSSCIGLIVFFVFALQCMSTLAVSRQETGSWWMPKLQFFAFSGIAYIASVAAVQTLRLAGFP